MSGRLAILLAAMLSAGPAFAEHPAECRVAAHVVENNFSMPKVAKAVAAKKLDILVMGAGSSSLPGPEGARSAYPARLEAALASQLPGVKVTVTTDVKSRRTATDMLKALPGALASRPALVVWQSGTVDAMLAVDVDQYSQALDKGINLCRAAGSDVLLINSQYSPRTESMIALGSYSEAMRWVALQQEVPLFDRFSVMKVWGDLGTFDLASATNKLDIATRVHDCIGRLIADVVVDAAKNGATPGR